MLTLLTEPPDEGSADTADADDTSTLVTENKGSVSVGNVGAAENDGSVDTDEEVVEWRA